MKVGIDLEDIKRFENKDKTFYEKIFTQNEIEYANAFSKPAEHFAGMFCAKESVIKTLETDKKISMLEIEILHNNNHSPKVELYGIAKNLFEKQNLKSISLSISHTKTQATAISLAE